MISIGPDYYEPKGIGKGAVKSLDACNDDRITKHQFQEMFYSYIPVLTFYIPPTCQTYVTVGSHCNCGSTPTDWQFSIEKGKPKTLYYLHLLNIQRGKFGYSQATSAV